MLYQISVFDSFYTQYHILCIHLSISGHVGSFYFWAIMNYAAMDIVCRSSCGCMLFSFWVGI